MKITLFGATGKLGRECLAQTLEAGHDVTVLVRNPDKLPQAPRDRVTVMREPRISRLVWCGGSNLRPNDVITFGARFVHWFSATFLRHRHTDKEHQLQLLDASTDVCWIGKLPIIQY